MKVICISASNIANSSNESTSSKICNIVKNAFELYGVSGDILDLRDFNLSPCIGCGKCFESKRCCMDNDFNTIYNKIVEAACVFFVSPHYAPIPAKLCMLLEKMEEITFLHWWKDNTYKSEVYNIPTGIISHGGGSDWALSTYKVMVNDTIANALDTIQCKLVPYNDEWNTGISIPVTNIEESNTIFPVQIYDWITIKEKIQEYVHCVMQVI
ncbi:MAG: NAD(P)H-dependent oxidoreductase [Lachnospiraceae bacterium]|nr:NAD(P)H-dependent oxidoreductase [Lachnospiraceae bacterium]